LNNTTSSMRVIVELTPEAWARYAALRLASLRDAPAAFGARYEDELAFDEDQWRDYLATHTVLVGVDEGRDVATLSLAVLEGPRNATCWITGCWTNGAVRGRGWQRALFDYVATHAAVRGWQRQGLGVWTDNTDAIDAYAALGFVIEGDPPPSRSQPGRPYYWMFRDS
jgi:GNAT superfamily N-acetyltransferase